MIFLPAYCEFVATAHQYCIRRRFSHKVLLYCSVTVCLCVCARVCVLVFVCMCVGVDFVHLRSEAWPIGNKSREEQ